MLRPCRYTAHSELFYEGQTPMVGYLLIDGHIQLLRNKKVKKILDAGTLLGVRELMTNAPMTYTAQILPETTVLFLDKSTIFELLKGHGPLSDSLRKFIQAPERIRE